MTRVVTLADLNVGERGTILGIDDQGVLNRRFRDLGIVPGQLVEIENVAPLGDPMSVRCQGTSFAIRKLEASKIKVEI